MKKIILYTMKGCPWCLEMKNTLKESKIKFIERDIDKHKDEYDLFVEATGNDYVPAFMLFTTEGEDTKNVKLIAPDRDYQDISEALIKVKEYLK
jgi:glutaredoxin